MSSVVISGDSSGAITLAAPSVAGTNTITLPASTGTVMVNGPAFSAYMSANQTISTGTNTKLQINTKEFDTATAYDASTNYRFTPLVAGYYQVNGQVAWNSAASGVTFVSIYKNGSEWKRGSQITFNAASAVCPNVSALTYFNGSTDYVELYVNQNSGGSVLAFGGSVAFSYFQASMVRSA